MAEQSDKLIREEQGILDRLIASMDEEILRLEHGWTKSRLEAEKQKAKSLPDAYGALIKAQDDKIRYDGKLKELQQARDELYQYRLVVRAKDRDREEEDNIELKVGLHTYMSGAQIFVSSWKQPVCRHYLLDNAAEIFESHVDHKGEDWTTTYRLQLKRDVQLRFDEVTRVLHHFPELTGEDETIYDEFLSELVKRRAEKEFKNIVFSIQRKQGEIIQQPFKQNMIVQGCAGSGKSMIMLHRLPILLYDNPNNLNYSNIYIITPSLHYIQMAQNMMYQLEISGLPMGTLEQYYEQLIEKYGRKLKDCGEKFSAEKLSPEAEQYLYSGECVKCVRNIIGWIKDAIENKTVAIQKAATFLNLDDETKARQEIRHEQSVAKQIQERLMAYQRILKKNREILQTCYKNIRAAVVAIEELRSVLRNRKTVVTNAINHSISVANEELEKIRKDKLQLDQEKNATAIHNRQEKIIEHQGRIIDMMNRQLQLSGDEPYFRGLCVLADELDESLQLYDGIKKDVGAYQLGDFYELLSLRAEFLKRFSVVEDKIRMIEDKYAADATPISKALTKAAESAQTVQTYTHCCLEKEQAEEIDLSYRYFQKLQKNLVMDLYRSQMVRVGQKEDAKGKLKRLSCSAYLYLQILYQVHGAPNRAAESLLTIDEAQGLALEELRLIKQVNRNQVVMNLFGDVKQHFENEKGIDNWNQLSTVGEFKRYDTNENYRNARQITEFCNRKFGTSMRAINLDGSGVKEYTIPEKYKTEIERILLLEQKTGTRAMIVSDEREAAYIMKTMKQANAKISDMTVDASVINEVKWNLMTIDQAKGLEFHTGIAIGGRMTKNQKYVAYTRALDQLYVFEALLDLSSAEGAESVQTEISIDTPKPAKPTWNSGRPAPQLTKIQNGVKEFFEEKGLTVIDQRSKSGCLWVLGEENTIGEYVTQAVEQFNITGRYSSGKATKFRPGWYTKTKK